MLDFTIFFFRGGGGGVEGDSRITLARLEGAEKADSQMAGNMRMLNLIHSSVLGLPG